jgi:hypothetical protein
MKPVEQSRATKEETVMDPKNGQSIKVKRKTRE